MSLLKLIRNENFKPTVKPGSAFPFEKRTVIEDGIPTIRFWKNGAPFLTTKEEDAVIAKFEAVLRNHWAPKVQNR